MATRTYSTGPIENFNAQSEFIFVKILNNSDSAITARVRVYRLNGTRTRIFQQSLAVTEKSSSAVVVPVATSPEFEVQIRIRNGSDSVDKVLASVFGGTGNTLNPSHRVLHKELKRI